MSEKPKSAHMDSPELRLRSCENRLDQGEKLHAMVLQCMQENTAAICKLELTTKGVVDAYADIQAAARVGIMLQKFAVWLLKFGGALAFLGWALNRFLEAWKHSPGP